ncbi:hypothetical protein SLEP1_g40665 [Rubroshorea leprosula]|uniref:Reverse transcriptase Ty1/copia-type domain-containing protein n=1 Tax=Rubroshorea leprosula TaxID=152421 RepID=A0AAV5L4K0_9ROSI|nr:hypothetical protein SLEP1_g40665 [Rubroshorea leprosula]
MLQYLQSVKKAADNMYGVGEYLTDRDIVFQALTGLDTEYSVAKRTISHRSPFPSFVDLQSLLLIEESTLQREKSISALPFVNSSAQQVLQTSVHSSCMGSSIPEAYYSGTQSRLDFFGINRGHGSFYRGGRGNKQGGQGGHVFHGSFSNFDRGFYSGAPTNPGHGSPSFLNTAGNPSSLQHSSYGQHSSHFRGSSLPPLLPNPPMSACQLCDQLTHKARDCPLLIGTNIASLSSAPATLTATTFPTVPDSKWYIDSGANTHVSSAPSNLSHSSPYSDLEFIQDIHLKNVLLHCNSAEGLYSVSSSSQSHPMVLTTAVVSLGVWHLRLGHPSSDSITQLFGARIKAFQCDNGREYDNADFATHFQNNVCDAASPASAQSASGPDASLFTTSIGDCPVTADGSVPTPTPALLLPLHCLLQFLLLLRLMLLGALTEPKTFKQACNLPEWQRVMQEEFLALQHNQTWVLVSPPSGANIVGSKWVYPIKQQNDGSIEHYKARLMAQGYTQQPGIDYDETCSPVVKPVTIRTIITLALSKSWPIHQLDVKNAFLNEHLYEPIYMYQPPGFVDPQYPDRACLLQHALTAYYDCSMCLYRSNASFNPDGLFLCQTKYIFDLLARTGMSDCNAAATPMSPRQKLAASDSPPYLDSTQYRSIVGALQYLTFTRPNIAFTIHQVCQYMHAPTQNHFQAMKRILRYLKGTAHYGLQLFKEFSPSLHIYIDNTIARSSAEAEYRAMANVVAEVVWVRQLLAELHVFLSSAPIVLCDNINALYLALNHIQHQRTKHIEIDIHFVRERVASRAILLQHVPSSLQRADILTKALSSTAFCSQRSNLCVLHQPAPIAGE